MIGSFVNNSLFSLNKAIILDRNGDVYYGGAINNKKSGRGCLLRPKTLSKSPKKLNKSRISSKGNDYSTVILGNWKNNKLIKMKDILTQVTLQEILTKNIDQIDYNLMIKPKSIYCGNLL